MPYASVKVKPPDSLAEVVALSVLLASEARSRKDNHILIGCMQASRKHTYFIAKSSHPMNSRTVHIHQSLDEGKNMQAVRTHCTLTFYHRAEVIAERNYTRESMVEAGDDLLHFMDLGVVRPAPLVSRANKGKELVSR